MTYSIVIATGGTAGHIYPALTFANALKASIANVDITFVGSTSRMESTIIPEHGYKFMGLDLSVPAGNIFHKGKAALSLVNATSLMNKYFKKHPCHCVVGFGNYIEYPVLHAAIKYNIPFVLHEQNAVLGKANKYFASKAKALMLSYPLLEELNNVTTIITGNPRSSYAFEVAKTKPLTPIELGFEHNGPLVTIVMGSLGSESVNKVLKECIPLMNDDRGVNYLISSGVNNQSLASECHCNSNVIIKPSIDGVQSFHASTLVVSRAGASACAEIFALAKPSILIPSPYVPNDHQSKNALAALKNKATYLLRENELNASKLMEVIHQLLNDKNTLDLMKKGCATLAYPQASLDMVNCVSQVIENGKIVTRN